MRGLLSSFFAALLWLPVAATAADITVETYDLPAGGGNPHDVAVGADGIVWYTAQRDGKLGRLDPATDKVDLIALGEGSAPHGVIIGPDGAPWITDGGLNAILRVDPATREVKSWPLPDTRGDANLNTATFDKRGRLWFTGQSGVYGRLDPESGKMELWDAPRGMGPYGITTTPGGEVYYASLAGSYIAHVDLDSGRATVIEPPTKGQGARRVWSDSRGQVWVSEWNAGQLSRYDPATGGWHSWKLPGDGPRAYAVYVDSEDKIWVSDFGSNAVFRFDPDRETFERFGSDKPDANVRQMNGRPGEVWAPESGADRLVLFRTR